MSVILASALSFVAQNSFLGEALGLESLHPLGLPTTFLIWTGRVGSMWQVSLPQVRPFQMSRTAFSLIPNKVATLTEDGHGRIRVLAASLI